MLRFLIFWSLKCVCGYLFVADHNVCIGFSVEFR